MRLIALVFVLAALSLSTGCEEDPSPAPADCAEVAADLPAEATPAATLSVEVTP